MSKVYEIYIVPNGSIDNFNKGYIDSHCRIAGWAESMDEVRDIIGRMAEETFDDSMQSDIFKEALCDNSIDDDEAVERADAIINKEREKFITEAKETLSLEYRNDQKFVRIVEVED